MLIENYDTKIEVATHSAFEFEYEIFALISVDLSPVMPLLNSVLKNGSYFSDGPAFSWRRGDHKIGIWPDKIAVDHLKSREEALEIIRELIALINDTWEKRDSIQPDMSTKENLQPLQIYKLLPKTNCKLCGASSCFAFALKVAAGQIEIILCDPLFKEETYNENRNQLLEMLKVKRTLI
jgi:ArsR family metal-binding transcriptional regulator